MPKANSHTKKPVVGIAVAALLLVLAGVIVIRSGVGRSGSPRIARVWFYDVSDGQLFAAQSNSTPPIAAPSGEEGVLAYVGSCGSCADDDAREIHYLEKWDEPTKISLDHPDDMKAASQATMDPLVAKPQQPLRWVRRSSDEGVLISSRAGTFAETCSGTYKQCTP